MRMDPDFHRDDDDIKTDLDPYLDDSDIKTGLDFRRDGADMDLMLAGYGSLVIPSPKAGRPVMMPVC